MSCHSCYYCEDDCQSCQGTCDDCQSFCERGRQTVGGFSFNTCLSTGQIFLSKESWDNLINYINGAYSDGRECNAAEYELPTHPLEENFSSYMTATEFNNVAEALCNLGNRDYDEIEVSKGDIIYGHYFASLEDYANRLKYKYQQCDRCDSYCDVRCDDCMACDDHSEAVYCCSSCESNTP